jgi:toluene monooxygenase system protein E
MPSTLKTYSHLAARRRQPTEYEIVTSRLHYYVDKGFEVNVPVAAWYERYQRGSRLQVADWEQFADPRETTYTKYTRLQQTKEAYVDGLLGSIDETGYDRELPPAARALLERALPPARFAFHGLQMVASYIGQMGPSGRITIAALLQAADELRRIHRIAYRMGQLRQVEPRFGEDSRQRWQTDPVWQPLREIIETLFVTYDWGEAFVALNVCLKPLVDDLFLLELGRMAKPEGDFLLGQILASLDEDCQWHRSWTAALVGVALRDRPENRVAIQGWIATWLPRAERALTALAPLLGMGDRGTDAIEAARRKAAAFRRSLELDASPGGT